MRLHVIQYSAISEGSIRTWISTWVSIEKIWDWLRNWQIHTQKSVSIDRYERNAAFEFRKWVIHSKILNTRRPEGRLWSLRYILSPLRSQHYMPSVNSWSLRRCYLLSPIPLCSLSVAMALNIHELGRPVSHAHLPITWLMTSWIIYASETSPRSSVKLSGNGRTEYVGEHVEVMTAVSIRGGRGSIRDRPWRTPKVNRTFCTAPYFEMHRQCLFLNVFYPNAILQILQFYVWASVYCYLIVSGLPLVPSWPGSPSACLCFFIVFFVV